MLHDGNYIEKESIVEGDLCILGAGAAGLSIAQEFLGTKHKVILIESGGLEFDEKTQSLYDGEDDSIGLGNVRSRYFGGSTNCWHGRCAPLDSNDFEVKDWVPNSGWPISRKDIHPFYERACDLLRIGSFDQFSSKDWDKNLFPGQYFHALKSPNSRIAGARFIESEAPHRNFGPRFKKFLRQAENIRVLLNSNVIALNANQNGSKIKDIRVATFNGNYFTVRAKIFILALGGIENPRMLLVSNSVEPAGIGNRYDQVGRYFMGHSMTDIGQIIYSSDQFCFEKELIAAPRGQLFFKLHHKIQKEERLLNAGLWLYRDISKGEMAFRRFRRNLLSGRFTREMGKQLLEMSENLSDVAHTAACNIQGNRKPPKLWEFWVQSEQPPNPDNRVMLGRKKDALGLNRLQVRRSMSDLGRRSVVRLSELFASEVTRFGHGRVRLDGRHLKSRLFSDDDSHGFMFGHDMGTTRMAENPKNGVVDNNCRVHGINNLYVAGSSVFTTSGYANPTLTIIALALRISDHIKSNLVP
jgi:choline dehydrogenase-like flavoprotein